MDKVISRDGTPIAFERSGRGHPLIFVTGAFNDHTTCAALARELAGDRTVITYDRRARGESGDTKPYAIEREIEDLAALIDGSAAVFGFSSGALLALKAATILGPAITHLALYEPPPVDHVRPDLPPRLAKLVEAGRAGDAVELFQLEGIGLPEPFVAQIRRSPMWPALEAMAQSVVYDATITAALADPTPDMIAVTTPALVLNGTHTWPALVPAAQALARALPAGRHVQVPGGESHEIPVAATTAELRAFLGIPTAPLP